ncbi:MAG: hypothetical protein ACOYD7_01005 [Raoultibacter sp.]|jgi:hypothetical protein
MAKEKSVRIGTDGNAMTAWQIWLRRLCIVMIVWAVLGLIAGLFFMLAPQFIDLQSVFGDEKILDLGIQEAFTLLSVSSLVGAFLNVVIAFLGIRGAENPKKVTLFFWIALIDAVLTAWALASNISIGIIDPTSIVSGLFIIALATCAWQVRKQTGYFDPRP